MATMNTVIEELDKLKPNVYDEDTKYKWMARLDGMISTQVHGEESPNYILPDDADTPLLVGEPFDDIYVLYCASMVDFYNREYNNYNNTMLMFTEKLEAYKAWYIQNHTHASAKYFRNVMG